MQKHKDLVSGSVLLALSIIYFLQALSVKKVSFIDPVVGSAIFPRAIAIVLAICSLDILLKGILNMRKANEKDKVPRAQTLIDKADEAENGEIEMDKLQQKKGNLKIAFVLGSLAAYSFLLDKIGFFSASFIYMLSQMLIMSHDRITKKGAAIYSILSAVVTAVVFITFRFGFGLMLPKALWF